MAGLCQLAPAERRLSSLRSQDCLLRSQQHRATLTIWIDSIRLTSDNKDMNMRTIYRDIEIIMIREVK